MAVSGGTNASITRCNGCSVFLPEASLCSDHLTILHLHDLRGPLFQNYIGWRLLSDLRPGSLLLDVASLRPAGLSYIHSFAT